MPHFLRQAVCEDLPDICTFELAYIREIEPDMTARWLTAIPLHLRQWINSLPRMTVAVEDGQAVGYGFWENDADENQAVVSSLYVVPGARRRGIGWELLRRCEQEAAAGVTWMELGVKRHNPAHLLYESAGYVFVHEQNGYDIYRKRLTR